MWFFIFWVLTLRREKKKREEEEEKKPIRVLVRRRARRCDRLQHASTRSIEGQPHAGLVVPSGGENGGKEKKKKKEERRRRSRSKKIHELIDSKGFEPRSNKTPGRDFSRSWSTRIRCDKPTFRTPALHFSPLRCVLFWFTRRFPGVFFCDFLLNAQNDVI